MQNFSHDTIPLAIPHLIRNTLLLVKTTCLFTLYNIITVCILIMSTCAQSSEKFDNNV